MRCLFLFGLAVLLSPYALVSQASETNAVATAAAKLVNELASPIGPPPEDVREYSGGKEDMKKLEARQFNKQLQRYCRRSPVVNPGVRNPRRWVS
jgi:hypothetical protein